MTDIVAPDTPSFLINCEIDGNSFSIELDQRSAPQTIAALRAALPATADLHCAKVAGTQLIVPIPFVCDFEGNDDVVALPAGSIIYYPRRQFLEILLGPVQEFGGTANYVGRVLGDLELMLSLCNKAVASAGQSILWVSMTGGTPSSCPPSKAVRELVALREQIWKSMPSDLWKLTTHFGVFGPIGPLFYAESEVRKLHEFLWVFRESKDPGLIRTAAGLIVASSVRQLREFFELTETSDALERAWALTCAESNNTLACFDEFLLCVGRLSLWLDNMLPWHAISSPSMFDFVEKAIDPKPR